MSDQDTNTKLVGEVEKHQELYNYRLSEYSRKEVMENAWKEVAAKMNMPGSPLVRTSTGSKYRLEGQV